MKYKIATKEDFESLIREIDSDLQKKNIPIHARELHAAKEVSKRLNITLPVAPLSSDPIPGNYEGASLSAHILEWFDNKYGDRLKIDFAIGYSLVLLKGDAWLLRFPLIFGKVTIVCERDLSKQFKNMAVNRAGQPHQKAIVNLLKLIEKLPQGLANQLTDTELRGLIGYYSFGHKFYNAAESFCRGKELAASAITDLKASAKAGIDNAQVYGQSLWLSLQASEKMLKFFIQEKGEQFPHTHDLTRLTKIASKLCLPSIDNRIVDEVQCDASVRYAQQECPVTKVVNAHQCAVKIGSTVMHALYGDKI